MEHEWEINIKEELRLIPLQEVNYIMYSRRDGTQFGSFEGQIGQKKVSQKLSYFWVQDMFHEKYLKWLRHHPGNWYQVPRGSSHE